jgi:lipopolysaccharide/colanic/teichoic acid biosynthesis glycosyltransferase
MQRILDIIFSSLGLILLSPLLIPLCVLLRLTGEGKILFLQNRIGKNGQSFKIFKFATMLEDSPNIGTGTITLKYDPRILPTGHILRKTKINELPQLVNVLLGHMSIIGPRPQTTRCFNAFPTSSKTAILTLRPGLSGLGSIIFRNEENMMNEHENPTEFYDDYIMPYKGRLEEWYGKNQTLSTYFKLIFLTILALIAPNNQAIWWLLPELPTPPKQLEKWLEIPSVGTPVYEA